MNHYLINWRWMTDWVHNDKVCESSASSNRINLSNNLNNNVCIVVLWYSGTIITIIKIIVIIMNEWCKILMNDIYPEVLKYWVDVWWGIASRLMIRWGSSALASSLPSDGVAIKILVVIEPYTNQSFLWDVTNKWI